MERTEILDMMAELRLFGMRAAYDETLATALKRQHEPQRFIGDLLRAEISEKQARSIKYQLAIAKLPLAKDIDDFAFKGTPINEALVRTLADGGFLAQQRNTVFIGGTGTGKTHLVIAIARSCIRAGSRGRFFTTVDLVNRLEAEARAGRQGRIADHLTRMDFVVLDELGYLPFAQSGCHFAWNRDPATGLMCVQSGPRRDGSRLASDTVGGFDWDAGCGDDRQNTSGLFFAGEGDQGDLPRAADFAQGGAESHPDGGDGVSLRAIPAADAAAWRLARAA